MNEKRSKRLLKIIYDFLIVFLLVSFVTTCCTMLFVSTLSASLDITLTEENIATAAKATFLNVLLLSVIFTTVDCIRRRITVEKPLKQITDAAEKIMKGDFSVRIKTRGRLGTDGSFYKVSTCFNDMAKELSSVETLRTDFIANVSHEMKTPLSVIRNYGTLLQMPDLTEEKRMEYAKGVEEASRKMADMVTNILKLNRLENQQIYPNAKKYDLGEQLCSCLLQYEQVWEKKGIEIDTDIADGVLITADEELLELVFSNLLSNAFKFTPSGGRVTVTLTESPHHATVTVSDTGCGMTKEVGARIFEKFYQADTSHASSGNGLGLALVKRIIEITGGEITVESTPEKGSAFSVRIRKE